MSNLQWFDSYKLLQSAIKTRDFHHAAVCRENTKLLTAEAAVSRATDVHTISILAMSTDMTESEKNANIDDGKKGGRPVIQSKLKFNGSGVRYENVNTDQDVDGASNTTDQDVDGASDQATDGDSVGTQATGDGSVKKTIKTPLYPYWREMWDMCENETEIMTAVTRKMNHAFPLKKNIIDSIKQSFPQQNNIMDAIKQYSIENGRQSRIMGSIRKNILFVKILTKYRCIMCNNSNGVFVWRQSATKDRRTWTRRRLDDVSSKL
jgi:hypothetical protein